MRISRAQVAAAEQPILQQIQAERKANLARAQQQMGFAKAAAALLQGVAPRVQDTYSNAANADAGYARGLGDNVQADINQRASADNDFLSKMGTPAGGLVHPADVGGTAYGLEGYIPATTLQREGAAFGSVAQMLPGNALKQGQQQASATLANDPNLASLQGELAKVAATQPDVYQKILQTLTNNQFRRVELGQGQQRIGLEAQRNAISAQQGQERINISAQSLAQRTLSQNRNYQIALKKLGISERSLQLRAMKAEAKNHGAGGGFTPDELVHIRGHAGTIAQNAFNGLKLSDGSPDPNHPPLGYKQAFKQEILAGIPPSIAIQSLKQAGYKVPVKANAFAGMVGGGFFGAVGQSAKIVDLAREYMGTPYVWGGESPKGFDCSGFAQFLYGKVGISIPRTTYTQWTARNGRPVKQSQLQPGDLVFFRGSDSRGGLPGHVGIYIGGGKMIDAPHTGADVRIDDVFSFGGYMGARRYH